MLPRALRFVALLAVASATVCAFAAEPPPFTVQARVLVMPPLPEGVVAPMNLPEDGALTLPFAAGGPPGVARRINDTVWREMLDGTPAPTEPGDTFTPPPDQLPRGTVALGYSADLIPPAAPRWLSLDFSGEACGAYCEDFAFTRVFDLHNGRVVTLGDLLTAQGFATVGRRVDAQRRTAYRQQVRQLKAARRAAPGDQSDTDIDVEDRLALNQECLRQATTEASTPERLLTHSFKLGRRNGLELSIGRCSNHASRALDDVGEITVTIPATELQSSLTAYGRAFVPGQGHPPPPAAGAAPVPGRP